MDFNRAALRGLTNSFSTLFNQGAASYQPTYAKITTTVNSTTASMTYPELSKSRGIREWIGDRQVQQLGKGVYTIENKEWEETLAVKVKDIKDDQIGLYSALLVDLGRHISEFPDQLSWSLLARGDKELCSDEQYFFDTDHRGWNRSRQVVSASNFKPGTKPAWVLIDNSQALKSIIYQNREPFKLVSLDKEDDSNVFHKNEIIYGVAGRCNVGFGAWHTAYMSKEELTAAAFGAARAEMSSRCREDGSPILITPKLLVVPTALEGAAKTIIKAETIGGTTNIWRDSVEILVAPWLG